MPVWLDLILLSKWLGGVLPSQLEEESLAWVARLKEIYYHVHKQEIKALL